MGDWEEQEAVIKRRGLRVQTLRSKAQEAMCLVADRPLFPSIPTMDSPPPSVPDHLLLGQPRGLGLCNAPPPKAIQLLTPLPPPWKEVEQEGTRWEGQHPYKWQSRKVQGTSESVLLLTIVEFIGNLEGRDKNVASGMAGAEPHQTQKRNLRDLGSRQRSLGGRGSPLDKK